MTSIHDELILEYRINFLRSQIRELESQREDLKDEINNLRAQKYNVVNQLRARQSELDAVKRDLEYCLTLVFLHIAILIRTS